MTSVSQKNSIAFVGSMIYKTPLDPTSGEKFQVMAKRGTLYVIGQTGRCAFTVFFEYANFILLPRLTLPGTGFISIQIFSPFILLWLIFRKNVNCIIAQSPFEGVPAALAKKIAALFGHKVALVIENHGDFEATLFLTRTIKFKTFYARVIRTLARFSLANADMFRAVSLSTAQQLSTWSPATPIAIYPAWMLVRPFYEAAKTYPRGMDILYAGDISYRKAIDILIEAFAIIHDRYPDTQLRLAGPSVNADFDATIQGLIKKHNLASHIQFLGKLPPQALAEEMAGAKVFVLPSRSEGMGRVLVESLAAGTPIVCADTGGMPGIAQDRAYSRIFPVENVPALAESLADFIAPYDNDQMRSFCQTRARECFDRDVYVDTMFEIIATARKNSGIVTEE